MSQRILRTLDIMDKAANLLYRFCINISTVGGFLMAALVFVRVVMRYGMSSGFQWSEEISVLLMMWMAFFGGSTLFYDKAIISVRMFVEKFPEKLQNVMEYLFTIGSMIFLGLLIINGYNFAVLGLNINFGALEIPRFWSYLAIPAGALFALYFCIVDLMHRIFPQAPLRLEREPGGDSLC
jgi:TRAP-type C4-dicarboxylate transport system permease small subunit